MSTDIIISNESSITQSMTNIAGQLASSSKRIYENDARHFALWIQEQGLALDTFKRANLIEYRSYLDSCLSQKTGRPYSKATKKRMFTVAVNLMKEARISGYVHENVTESVKGFKSGNDETTHTALNKQQSKEMLASVNTSTIAGKRDYTILLVALKTGLRRAELAALKRSDLKMMDGHRVAVVEHGKGDKTRVVKLRTEVYNAIQIYLESLPEAGKDAPLFVRVLRGDHPTSSALTGESIEDIVKKYAPADTELTPHGLRATYATIALESGAPLEQVQYSMGHSDPRTTERYQKRKLNLDNNAVDYLNF
jgi:integrase/recombinase XerD